MGIQSKSKCTRNELIKKVRKVLDSMENAKVEDRCCCTDPDNPPPGVKVVSTATLDGQPGVLRTVPVNKEKYIWIPPPIDNRPALDPTMSCYAATVANQFYDQYKGCRLDCAPSTSDPHSHWWNDPNRRGAKSGAPAKDPDYCEDPSFVPPEPLGHQAWTNEPGGICRYPQYCKAACFDHSPERDWARH